jgi:hypothetical protein
MRSAWRAQPIGQHRENPLVQGRVGAPGQADEHALQQYDEVGCPDLGTDRACLLGAAQQQVERREQVLAQRAGDRDSVGQVALGGCLRGDPGTARTLAQPDDGRVGEKCRGCAEHAAAHHLQDGVVPYRHPGPAEQPH